MSRKHVLFTLLLTLAMSRAALGADPAAVPSARPNILSLSQAAAANQAEVRQRIATNQNPEAALAKQYSELQQLCAAKFEDLEADSKRYAQAEARTQVIGNILALIGSVTAYAPGKTVLMGLGISSGNSGTVSSSVTQFFSTQSTASAETLALLKAKLNEVFDRYDLIDPDADKRGVRRGAILARGTGVCLNLAAASSTTPPTAATPGSATPPADAASANSPAPAAPPPSAPASSPS